MVSLKQDAPLASSAAETAAARQRSAWWMVFALGAIYLFAGVDRIILAVMLEDIRLDLRISDVEVSLLQGAAFGLFYSLMGLPLGGLADRLPRRAIIYAGVTAWSVCSAATGLAPGFPQLFLARMGVGVGEATLSPSAYSLLSDRFPRERLAAPISVYTGAASLGTGLAMFLGGALLEYFAREGASLPGPLGGLAPWRLVLIATGVPGLLIAFLAFSFREPARRAVAGRQVGWGGYIGYLRRHARLHALLLGGFGFVIIVSYGINSWGITYLRRSFHVSPAQAGLMIGAITSICGLLGHGVNGFVVDALRARGHRDAPIRFYLGCAILGAPLVAAAYLAGSLPIFLAGLVLQLLVVTPVVGYAGAAVQAITPPGMQGKAGAVFLLVINMMGLGLGPTLVAAIGEALGPAATLGQSMALVVAAGCGVAGALLLAGRRRFVAAVSALEAQRA